MLQGDHERKWSRTITQWLPKEKEKSNNIERSQKKMIKKDHAVINNDHPKKEKPNATSTEQSQKKIDTERPNNDIERSPKK